MASAPAAIVSHQMVPAARDPAPTPPFLLVVYFGIFFFALILIEMDLPSFDTGRPGEEEGSRIAYPLYIMLCFLLLPVTLFMYRNVRLLLLPWTFIVLFSLYACWCLVTAYWSPMRITSAVHAIVLLLTLFLAINGVVCKIERLIVIFVIVCSFIFLVSWSALPVSPDYALADRDIFKIKGIMMHEFRLGYLAAMCLICCLIAFLTGNDALWRYRHLFVFAGVFAFITLLATQTRSLTAYTAICISIIIMMSESKIAKMLLIIGAVFITVFALIFWEPILATLSRGETDASLSGRTLVWEWTWQLAQENLWLGTGFKSYYHAVFDNYFGGYRPPHAHNDVLNALTETGVPGAILLVLFNVLMLVSAWRWQKTLKRPSIGFAFMLLATMAGTTGQVVSSSMATMFGIAMVFYIQEGYTVAALRARAGHFVERGTEDRWHQERDEEPEARVRGAYGKQSVPQRRRIGERWRGTKLASAATSPRSSRNG